MGRIPVMATLDELSIDDLIRVLAEPKNAIIKQYQALFELDGVELEFEEGALEYIAKEAQEKGVGARGLRGILEKIMLPLQYELPSCENVTKCIISEDFAQNKAPVTLVTESHKERENG
jgi:ATP-dependent Clp protease ATP-binding subunit ClpX